MASIACHRLPSPSSSVHADPNSAKFPATTPISLSHYPRRAFLRLKKTAIGASRAPVDPFLCRCHKTPPSDEQGEGSYPADSSAAPGSWASFVQDVVSGAAKRWDELLTACRNSWSKNGLAAVTAAAVEKESGEEKKVSEVVVNEDGGEWDWERWNRHFVKVEEQEKLISVLKSQLNDAISKEDYEHAAKLKLAISGATGNDVVETALSIMNRAIEEERYSDAAFIRDHAGAGLVGWWAGISEDGSDPYGRIICISAEYGRYVARSYSPRQLATGRPGFPLFEVFYTKTNGEYKEQVVYLKQHERSGDLTESEKEPGFSNLNLYDDLKGENSLQNQDIKTIEGRDDDSNITDGISIIQDVLRDLIPGVKVRVLKLVSPGKVDRDAIAKVVEQIMEEEEEGSEEDGSDEELKSIESEDLGGENDVEEIKMEAGDSTSTSDGKSEVSLKVVITRLTPKLSADVLPTNLVRIPASLEKIDLISFSIILGQDPFRCAIDEKRRALKKKSVARKSADLFSFELAKLIPDKNKIHLKVLKDLQELINDSVNYKQNYQSLSEATFFSRIELPLTSDPLSGLYIGSYGMYNSNILHLKHKFGQWQEDHTHQKHMDLEFYEYVEAIKLTGDPSVPAGQVAFRAKVGTQHQLPHKGIIPEEFGVIARYRGQGRLADPGFRNPRWVDGELVIFDGKYIRGGPVIGFVYWAPDSHFFLFFNRLRLPA